jgi:hypothetical protein
MSIPGFTAEASLYNVSARYRATAEAAVYGGLVQPALSDRIELYPRLWCLKRFVEIGPTGVMKYTYEVGIWNYVTHRCD